VLSTLPLADPLAIELPYEGQRRVAVSARVEVPSGPGTTRSIRFVSAHLDNRARWSRLLDSFGAARTRQANALVAALGGDDVVLGADLNTWAPGFLEGAAGVLARAFPDAPAGSSATFRWAGVVGRTLDRVLVPLEGGHEIRVDVASERYGSDHHPVVGIIGRP
jgi:endonuclease/exonuclease/phosphatase family metal-dependent hydrolase